MKNNPLVLKIRKEGMSFLEEVSKSSEIFYYGLLSLYVVVYLMMKIAWHPDVDKMADTVRYGILSVVMWGSALYLFYTIANWKDLWKKNLSLIVVGAALLAVTFLFSRVMSTNTYGVVMDIYFCLMIYGKSFKKALKCILTSTSVMLVIAGLGVIAGFTMDLEKPFNIHPGHSLGIIYPNTWGYLAFLILIIVWYLYLRQRPVLTFVVFWCTSAIMLFYIWCRTIAIMSLAFPVMAVVVDLLERSTKNREKTDIDEEGMKDNKQNKGVLKWLIIIIPLLLFALNMILSMNVEWMHRQFFHTWFDNFAERFVQSGLYFRTYGFPIVGNPYRSNEFTYVNVNGEFIQVGVLDSSFAAYIIMRGVLWIAYTLLWLCVANWKALKKRDFAIPLISAFFLVFAMLERPGLEMWYNFILLYPLAGTAVKIAVENAEQMNDVTAETNTDSSLEEDKSFKEVDTADDTNQC